MQANNCSQGDVRLNTEASLRHSVALVHLVVLHVLDLTIGSGRGRKLAAVADLATATAGMVNTLVPQTMISISSVSESY